MRGKSHLIAGIATGIVISEHLNINPLITIGLSTLGSVIVDIDEQSSTINKVLFPFVKQKDRNKIKAIVGAAMVLQSFSVLVRYFGVLILLSIVSSKVQYKFSIFKGFYKREYHRTYFHDPIIGTILFVIPFYIMDIPNEYKIAFIVGVMLGHYLMDMFTHYGLPLYILKVFGIHKPLRIPLVHFDSRNKVAENIVVISYAGLMILIRFPFLIEYIKNLNL